MSSLKTSDLDRRPARDELAVHRSERDRRERLPGILASENSKIAPRRTRCETVTSLKEYPCNRYRTGSSDCRNATPEHVPANRYARGGSFSDGHSPKSPPDRLRVARGCQKVFLDMGGATVGSWYSSSGDGKIERSSLQSRQTLHGSRVHDLFLRRSDSAHTVNVEMPGSDDRGPGRVIRFDGEL